LPGEHARTFYHWLFAGQFGIDTYSATTSEVYQDVFGQGTFTGKGLLNVKAVHQVLGSRFPDGQVLSHDLLEGALVRCATVTDVTVLEEGPHLPDTANARIHRWTRGDWQLLPFMLHFWRYGITPLNLWKMLDNLRRSLVAPACLLLLVLSVSWCGAGAGHCANAGATCLYSGADYWRSGGIVSGAATSGAALLLCLCQCGLCPGNGLGRLAMHAAFATDPAGGRCSAALSVPPHHQPQ